MFLNKMEFFLKSSILQSANSIKNKSGSIRKQQMLAARQEITQLILVQVWGFRMEAGHSFFFFFVVKPWNLPLYSKIDEKS